MSEREPLPLPWRAEPYTEHQWGVRSADGFWLARTCTEAEARMIAASPRLLDFVKRVVMGCETCHSKGYWLPRDYTTGPIACDACAVARALVAEAERSGA